MDNLNFNVYMLNENLEDYESIIQFDDLSDPHETDILNQPSIQMCNRLPLSNIITPWNPSKKLSNLHKTFQQTILNQFPCLPCSNCSYLLYPEKAKWIQYDENILYPFKTYKYNMISCKYYKLKNF